MLSESKVDPSSFDVIVLFHPGFLLYPQWFDAEGLQKITSAQKPVMVTSFNPEEQEVERRLLAEYGYQAASICDNPINIPSPHYPDKWGSSIWQLSGLQHPPLSPDPEKIAELTLTAEMLVRSRTAVYGPCERVTISNVPLVHIAAGHFVDPKSAECFFIQGKSVYDAGSLSANELATMPDANEPLVDRLLWGAKLQRART